ncbi:MAG TPA: hypothetical protein PLI68_02865 [Bacteroidia bacterium]|nr:hypothetical protein [Bacteroidia bacterium]
MNNYNRFINSKFVLPVLVFTLIFTSCKKEPGPGGRATIKGKVYAEYWDKYFVSKQDSSYAPNVDVYIIYGNEATFGDNQKAAYDGTYEFKYLQKGSYKIYAYSRDSSGVATGQLNTYAPNIAIVKTVEITERKQIVEVDDIKILK